MQATLGMRAQSLRMPVDEPTTRPSRFAVLASAVALTVMAGGAVFGVISVDETPWHVAHPAAVQTVQEIDPGSTAVGTGQ